MASKRRHFDVMMTLLLCRVSAGMPKSQEMFHVLCHHIGRKTNPTDVKPNDDGYNFNK